jgi:hypothetical protein
VFEANSTAYMVMRFEIGLSFENWLANLERPPTQGELDTVIAPLLDALEVMHKADFLHRDIAPDNIIIRADGTPVLLDFGAARRGAAPVSDTLSGVVKAGYSPHEQYTSDGRLQGPWSDIYAFGSTLYRAVTGKAPEEATLRFDKECIEPATKAAKGRYRRRFLAAIDACLKVLPSERPQSVAELRPMLLKTRRRWAWPVHLIPTARIAAAAAAIRQHARPGAAAIAGAILLVACAYAGLAYRPLGEAEARQSTKASPAAAVDADEVRRREAIAAAEAEAESRRNAEKAAEDRRKQEERTRLADIPTDEQRAAYVKRVQDVLKRSQCYAGEASGRPDDAQGSLDRFVEGAGQKGNLKPGRIVLAKAGVSDFETWLRDASGLERVCAPKAPPKTQAKPVVPDQVAKARPVQPAREYTPRYARSYQGDDGPGLVLGVGH